jgi:hypothetical protein
VRSIVYGLLGLVIGIGLFIGGIASSGEGEVKCGGQTMSPGDTCRTTSRGGSTERSYGEQKSQNGREAVLMMIFGPIVAIGGLVFFAGPALGRRRRTHQPPAHPGYPPAQPAGHPGYPPAQPAGHPGYPPAQPPAQPGSGYPPAPPPAHYPPSGGHPPHRG